MDDVPGFPHFQQQRGRFPAISHQFPDEHGIIYTRKARGLDTVEGTDLEDEIWSAFGSGTQMQEIYMTPQLLEPSLWDTLARAAIWARENNETLVDVHWVGGSPMELQVYGWSAWSPAKGLLTIRNPSSERRTWSFDPGSVFELPAGSSAQLFRHFSQWKAAPVLRAPRRRNRPDGAGTVRGDRGGSPPKTACVKRQKKQTGTVRQEGSVPRASGLYVHPSSPWYTIMRVMPPSITRFSALTNPERHRKNTPFTTSARDARAPCRDAAGHPPASRSRIFPYQSSRD